jgi:peptidyl-prolyl cis-trans isomerase SurA
MNKYLLILAIPTILFAQLDRIAGVVDKEAITLSEVDEKLTLSGFPITQEARKQILESIIQTKLLIIAAERETLSVSDEDIEEALVNTINSMKENFPSLESFYAELERLGITEEILKDYYRNDVKGNLLVRALIQKKFGNLSVSDIEALHFYNTYPDSIPDIPTTARYMGVFIPIIPEKTLRKKQELIERVKEKLLGGEEFGKIAGMYSEDPFTKNNEGKLGVMNVDDLDPGFRQEVRGMDVGDIKAVQTRDAIHLLRCDMRMGSHISLRDIVFKLTPTKEDTSNALSLASNIKDSLERGEIPGEGNRTAVISDGNKYLPLPPIFEELPIGETRIIESEDGIYVMKILDKKESRRPTFEEVKENLKAYLSQIKTEEKLKSLLSKLGKEIFVERRL